MIRPVDFHCHWNSDFSVSMNDSTAISFICSEDYASSSQLLTESPVSDNVILHAGIHPWYIDEQELWQDELNKIKQLFQDSKGRIKGIGEIGLDKSRGHFKSQKDAFREQLEVAIENYIHVVNIHCVRAYGSLLEIMNEYPNLLYIIHGYKGDPAMTEQFHRALEHKVLFSFSPAESLELANNIQHKRNIQWCLETDYPHTRRYPADARAETYSDTLFRWYQNAAGLLNMKLENLINHNYMLYKSLALS